LVCGRGYQDILQTCKSPNPPGGSSHHTTKKFVEKSWFFSIFNRFIPGTHAVNLLEDRTARTPADTSVCPTHQCVRLEETKDHLSVLSRLTWDLF
jgi:hypothetical protein